MTSMATAATPMTTEQLIARWHQLEQQRAAVVAEQDAIKTLLRANLPTGKTETPVGTVTLTPNRRFDDTTARVLLGLELAHGRLTQDQVNECWKTALDSAAVKKIVAPDKYDDCMKVVGDPKVTVA